MYGVEFVKCGFDDVCCVVFGGDVVVVGDCLVFFVVNFGDDFIGYCWIGVCVVVGVIEVVDYDVGVFFGECKGVFVV